MSDELKPCPFCGGTDLKLYTTHGAGYGNSNRRGVVRCSCGCELRVTVSTSLGDLPADMPVQEKYDTLKREAKRAVFVAWNRRADHDSFCPECGGALHKVVEPTTNDVGAEDGA